MQVVRTQEEGAQHSATVIQCPVTQECGHHNINYSRARHDATRANGGSALLYILHYESVVPTALVPVICSAATSFFLQ